MYKQAKPSAEDLCYYDLVSRAEVLRGAHIDDTDVDCARVTLLPMHADQVARVHATAIAAESSHNDFVFFTVVIS